METIKIPSRYSFREDTLENWNENNPILARGEPSIVRNPNNEGEWLKIGDGETDWRNLPYKTGIADVERIIRNVLSQTNKITTINVLANKWVYIEEDVYSQVINIEGTTNKSLINISLTLEQHIIFRRKDITFFVGNNNGIITVYCIGQKPTNDYTLQVKITEVAIDE